MLLIYKNIWKYLHQNKMTNNKTPKGIIRMDQTRINYYKSLISYDKRDSIVEQIIKEKMSHGKKRKVGREK